MIIQKELLIKKFIENRNLGQILNDLVKAFTYVTELDWCPVGKQPCRLDFGGNADQHASRLRAVAGSFFSSWLPRDQSLDFARYASWIIVRFLRV